MGVTTDTAARLVLGAGDLTFGGTDVGATMEGTVFRVERTLYNPDLNGVRGPLKGTVFVLEEIPFLEVTLTEITGEFIGFALPGVSVASDVSSDIVSGSDSICLSTSDYKDLILTIPKCDGTDLDVIITITDALAISNLEMTWEDDGITTFRITFRGHYDASAPLEAPWSMEIEQA